jgi:hypothetical protein
VKVIHLSVVSHGPQQFDSYDYDRVLEHLIGSAERIDVPRSCAFVIQAITLVCEVTCRAASAQMLRLARLFAAWNIAAFEAVTTLIGCRDFPPSTISAVATSSKVTRAHWNGVDPCRGSRLGSLP